MHHCFADSFGAALELEFAGDLLYCFALCLVKSHGHWRRFFSDVGHLKILSHSHDTAISYIHTAGFLALRDIAVSVNITNMKNLKKFLWKALKVLLFLSLYPIVIFLSGSTNPIVEKYAIWITLIVFSPYLIFLFLQICFWMYHWMAHGDPFYESPTEDERRGKVGMSFRDSAKKRQKNMCPICKRQTSCKVERTPSGFWIHIVKGH